mgnify:CR=1 FL=1
MSKYTPTAPETDDLQKLLDAATPGPWVAEEKTGPASEWARSNLGVWSEHRLTLSTTADDGDDPMDDAWLCGIWGQLSEDDFANARLIALAPTLAADLIALRAEVATLRASDARMREALNPSGDTKAAYMGEFSVPLPDTDEDGNEVMRQINVPWTTIKQIMAAISARAALQGETK